MAKGGVRPGAGRKKGSVTEATKNAQAAKELLVQMYLENVRPINEALLKKAKEGDLMAIRELHDRVYGRSPQSVDLTSGGKEFQPIAIIPRPSK